MKSGRLQRHNRAVAPQPGCRATTTMEKHMGNQVPLALGFADDLTEWTVKASEGVEAKVFSTKEGKRSCLNLDYNFNGKAGYILIRRKVDIDLPENYRFAFEVRGESPANTLELKLIDPTGENVFWSTRPAFAFAKDWQTLKSKARHFSYAWGPDRTPIKKVGFVELVVTASTGGSGSVSFANLTFEELPPQQSAPAKPLVKVSSGSDSASAIVDGIAVTSWQSDRKEKQQIVLDLKADREFGGLMIDWHDDDYAVDYTVDARAEGERSWRRLATITGARPCANYVHAPESEARFIRLRTTRSSRKQGYRLYGIYVKPLAFGASKSAFFESIARDNFRGRYPRHLLGEQSNWTVVGVPGDSKKALVNEEGMVEVEKLGFSLEPFLYTERKGLLTWADGTHEQSLAEGHLPLPEVVRTHEGCKLAVKCFAYGDPGRAALYVTYTLTNTGAAPLKGQLFVAARPFQVNPSWQFLNSPGGSSPINSIAATGSGVLVNGHKHIFALSPKFDRFGATSLNKGDISVFMRDGKVPGSRSEKSEDGFASGAMAWDFDLAPGAGKSVTVCVLFHDIGMVSPNPAPIEDEVLKFWRDKLARVKVSLPDKAKDLENTLKAQVAYILLNMRGAAIQPGSRSYDRSWARDGALTASALLRLGYNEEVKRFIEWFAGFQFMSGKIPCVVDRRGADPTPEHDSTGQFIFLVAEYYRFTGDREMLEKMYPRIRKAVQYIYSLIEGERTRRRAAEAEGGDSHLAGILPPSISHEGYSDKPAYSYWDNFWCVKGLADAVYLVGEVLGKDDPITRLYADLHDGFKRDVIASVKSAMAHHGTDFIAGAADRGDFDPTSTTIAIDPCGLIDELKPELLSTFDRYWPFFLNRRGGQAPWSNYTPYELRSVGAYVRLGYRERAHELIEWFMRHRRPSGWLHWAEVVHNDPLTPAFIGDMPHTWVGSDLVRSLLSMLVYEREDGVLVLGQGVSFDWMYHPGNLEFDLPTPHGRIHLKARRSGYRLYLDVEGDVSRPVVLALPFYCKDAYVNGHPAQMEMQVGKLPASIRIELS